MKSSYFRMSCGINERVDAGVKIKHVDQIEVDSVTTPTFRTQLGDHRDENDIREGEREEGGDLRRHDDCWPDVSIPAFGLTSSSRCGGGRLLGVPCTRRRRHVQLLFAMISAVVR